MCCEGKVLSTRAYNGKTIEHIEVERFRSDVPFHGTYYQKLRSWWIVEDEIDFPTLREAKQWVDEKVRVS